MQPPFPYTKFEKSNPTLEPLWFKENKSHEEILELIDYLIDFRTTLFPEDVRAFETHVITREESGVYDAPGPIKTEKMRRLAFGASMTPGPVVLYVNHVKGYGLFAERDYVSERGEDKRLREVIATYGGRRIPNKECTGPYTIHTAGNNRWCWNADYGWTCAQKGRFINDYRNFSLMRNSKKHVNVQLIGDQFDNANFCLDGNTRSVSKGQEFLWDYGYDYFNCLVCGKLESFITTTKDGGGECGLCDAVYCSDKCADVDWYERQHYQKHEGPVTPNCK
jgi:hypothetical protein